jgi:hypothetical protein
VSTFESLPLHDATLVRLTCEWGEGVCTAMLRLWEENTKESPPYLLRWEGVTDVAMPRLQPWGPSVSVNTVTLEGKVYQLEMQSGDLIKVTAERFAFIPEGAA